MAGPFILIIFIQNHRLIVIYFLIWKENLLQTFFFLSQECVSSFSSIEKKDETQAFFEMIPKNNQVRFLCDFLIDFIIS